MSAVGSIEASVEGQPNMMQYPKPRAPMDPVLSFRSFSDRGASTIPSVTTQGQALFVTSGRVALALALQGLGVGPGQKVLLPAYNCKAMVAPVEWCGATPALYRLREDLAVDLDDLADRLDGATRCLVVVHYFGFPQKLATLRRFCDDNGIALIEDCAHSFFGAVDGRGLGALGEYAIASPMKFYPIYDGGVLVCNRDGTELPPLHSAGLGFEVKALVNMFEQACFFRRLRPFHYVLSPMFYLKDRVWALVKRSVTNKVAQDLGPAASDGGYDFDPKWLNVRMSAPSAFVFRNTADSRLVAQRRANFQWLLGQFEDIQCCSPLFRELGDNVVPYVFPLVVENPAKVFSTLKASGVPMFRWEDIDPTVCPVSARYAESLFQLPCHQELRREELEWIVSEVHRAVAA